MKYAHKIFKLLLLSPLGYWAYLIVWGDLGVEPAKTLLHNFGYVALIYLVANMWIGALISLFSVRHKILRFLLLERRFLGVFTFIILIFHLCFYFIVEGLSRKAVEQLYTKTYLIFAVLAFSTLFLLAITSNNYSVKKLGGKTWKKLHRFIYLAALFVTVHIFLIEKADLVNFALITGPIWLVQIYRLIQFLKGKRTSKSEP